MMKKISTKKIRKLWIDFFISKNHHFLPSKSLLPKDDSSLLWINSGVATLKKYFSGLKKPLNSKIVNIQKCLRTNDIENVGLTSRHHTFFEMLGNFSIGDYGKEKAIELAYEFLFKILKIDKNKIYITYFNEDQLTKEIWKKLSIDEKRIIPGNKKTNFWDVGLGPCGPCSEIFYDRGTKYDQEKIGLKLLKEDIENDRYIEIWNIVFSEFNNDGNGNYEKLLQKNIDTGAGLERIASIFQDTPTNFETDLFFPIIKKIEKITNYKYDIDNYFKKNHQQNKINYYFKVMADHIRAATIAINDGALPSNQHQGYIIRRLIRRAYRFGKIMKISKQAFLYNLVDIIAEIFDLYEIDIDYVKKIIKKEEINFSKTIENGEQAIFEAIKKLKNQEFDFKVAFKLFETYGMPVELTKEILKEQNINLDISNFEKLKKEHAIKSTTNKHVGMARQIQIIQKINQKLSNFIGYNKLQCEANLLFYGFEKGYYYYLFDQTPFYATGGGQEHDFGFINEIEVIGVFKDKHHNNWHITKDAIPKSKKYLLKVKASIRLKKESNHSATHLLNIALIEIFGKQIKQLGSYNDEHKLHFDFSLPKKPSEKQIRKIEEIVNKIIKKQVPTNIETMDLASAKKANALMIEGEDYFDYVRVVTIDKSKELCGGTHVKNTKIIENFLITKIESKGTQIFRIEALTSFNSINNYQNKIIIDLTKKASSLLEKNQKLNSQYQLKIDTSSILKIKKTLEKLKDDNKNLKKSNYKNFDLDDHQIIIEKNYKIIFNFEKNPSILKLKAAKLRELNPNEIVLLIHKSTNKKLIVVATKKYHALNYMLQKFPKIKGGGNQFLAMGSLPINNEK